MIFRKTAFITYLIMFALAAVLSGCFGINDDNSNNDNPVGPVPGSSTGTIDPATGGSVTYGNATLDFPAGVVNTATDVTVAIPDNPPTLTPPANTAFIGATYQFSPSMTFNQPGVIVTFSYNDADLGAYDENGLTILRYASANAVPVELTNIYIDTQNNTISGRTLQFSFGKLAILMSTPPPAPQLSSPNNNATDQPLSLNFTWQAAATALAYQLQVSLVSDFSSTFFDEPGIMGTSRSVSGLAASTLYYWRVRGANNAGIGSWSNIWTFTTGTGSATPPPAPQLSLPVNNSTNQPLTLNLSWQAAATAFTYQLQVSLASNFGSLFFDQSGLTGTSQAVGGLTASTQYYWRVRGTNDAGPGEWSEVWNFTTGTGGGGGALEGTWLYQESVYTIVDPIPYTDIALSGYGNTVATLNGGNFTAEGIRYLQEIITVYGSVVLDTIITIPVDLGGTYTIAGGQITTTITFDNNNPGNVGQEATMDYVVEGNSLTFSYSDMEAGYQFNIVEYYTRQ